MISALMRAVQAWQVRYAWRRAARMSGGSHIVEDMNANLPRAAKPERPGESAHVTGYLEAHERVADGDADSPDNGELWVPDDLDAADRDSWLEGFRSHFEP